MKDKDRLEALRLMRDIGEVVFVMDRGGVWPGIIVSVYATPVETYDVEVFKPNRERDIRRLKRAACSEIHKMSDGEFVVRASALP